MKATLAERRTRDRERLQALESLIHFNAIRATKLLLTPLRAVRMEVPAEDVARLFDEYVLFPSRARLKNEIRVN